MKADCPKGLKAGLIIAALAAPVLFGCVDEWAVAGLTAFLFALLFFYPEPVLQFLELPFFIKAAAFLLFAWIFIQGFTLAKDPYAAGAEFFQWIALGGAFLLVQRLGPSGIQQLLWAVVLLGCLESLYVLFLPALGHESVLWRQKTAYLGYATGTYINRNHFAGLLELCLGIHLGFIAKAFIRRQFIHFGILALLGLISFWALIKTGSRAGICSFMISAAFIFGGLNLFKRGQRSFAALFLGGLLLGAFFLFRPVAEKFLHVQDFSWSFAGRLETWKDTVRMIADHGWGTGLGSFGLMFPHYQAALSLKGWWHAHQDYLELLVELGIPGFLPWLALMGGLWISLFKKLLRGNLEMDPVGCGILTAVTSLAIHGLMDFNWAIPANAFLSVLLLGAGIRWVSFTDKSFAEKTPVQQSPLFSNFIRVLTLLLFVLSVPRAWAGVLFYQGKTAFQHSDYPRAIQRFEAAKKWNPFNPSFPYWTGISFYRAGDKTGEMKNFQEAAEYLREATQKLPDHGKAWAYLALAEIKTGEPWGLVKSHFDKAAKMNPGDPWIAYKKGRSFFLRKEALTPVENQQAIEGIRQALSLHYKDKPSPLLDYTLKDLWRLSGDIRLLKEVTPEDLPSYKRLIDFMDRHELWKERDPVFLKYWELKRRAYEEQCLQGRFLLGQKKFPQAFRVFQTAYWLEKQYFPARAGMFAAQKRLGWEDPQVQEKYRMQEKEISAGNDGPPPAFQLEYPQQSWTGGRSSGLLEGRAVLKMNLGLKPGTVEIHFSLRAFSQKEKPAYVLFYLGTEPVGSLAVSSQEWQTRTLQAESPGGWQRLRAELLNGAPQAVSAQGPRVELGQVRLRFPQ